MINSLSFNKFRRLTLKKTIMKKFIFLFTIFLFISIRCFSQEVKEISGPTICMPGQVYKYTIVFTAKLSQATQFIIKSDKGKFSNGLNNYSEYISAGKSEIALDFTWNTGLNGEYTIEAYRTGSATKIIKKVKVAPGEFTIEGPEVIKYGKTVDYYFKTNQKIEEWSKQGTDSRLIFEAAYAASTKIRINTPVKEPVILNEGLVITLNYSTSPLTAKRKIIIEPDPIITTDKRSVCLGTDLACSIQDLPSNAIVTWTCNSETKQGNPAIFNIKAKKDVDLTASIKYNNGYVIKVSKQLSYYDAPTITRGPMYDPEDAIILPNFTNSVEVLSYIKGATDYKWTFVKGQDKCVRYDSTPGADRVWFWPAKPTSTEIYNEYVFEVIGSNSCGTVRNRLVFIYPNYNRYSNTTRSIQPENIIDGDYSVKVYDLAGILVYSNNSVNGAFDIRSTVLTDGVYIIEKFDGENRTSEKVMLKR